MVTMQQQPAQQACAGDHHGMHDHFPAATAFPVNSSCTPLQYAAPVAWHLQQTTAQSQPAVALKPIPARSAPISSAEPVQARLVTKRLRELPDATPSMTKARVAASDTGSMATHGGYQIQLQKQLSTAQQPMLKTLAATAATALLTWPLDDGAAAAATTVAAAVHDLCSARCARKGRAVHVVVTVS